MSGFLEAVISVWSTPIGSCLRSSLVTSLAVFAQVGVVRSILDEFVASWSMMALKSRAVSAAAPLTGVLEASLLKVEIGGWASSSWRWKEEVRADRSCSDSRGVRESGGWMALESHDLKVAEVTFIVRREQADTDHGGGANDCMLVMTEPRSCQAIHRQHSARSRG